MVELVVFLLIVFGMVYAITESVVFAALRIWLAPRHPLLQVFVYCASCVGFWTGAGAYLLVIAPRPFTGEGLACAVLAGFLVMGAISVLRGLAPDFFPGATEREQGIVNERAQQRRARGQAGERSAEEDGDDDFDGSVG